MNRKPATDLSLYPTMGPGVKRDGARRPGAAVVHEGQDGAHDVAKVVPASADVVSIRGAILGYALSPAARPRSFHYPFKMLTDIEKLITHRWGGFRVETDDMLVEFATLVANLIVPAHAQIWIANRLPRLPADQARAIIAAAQRRPRRFSADQAAKMLHVVRAEREACDLRTIGAVDFLKAARTRHRKVQRREREEARRRTAGAKPRAEYVAESVAEEARRTGVSRMTIYRRRAAETKQNANSECYRSEANLRAGSYIGHERVTSRPRPAKKGDREGLDQAGGTAPKAVARADDAKPGTGRNLSTSPNPAGPDGDISSNHPKNARRSRARPGQVAGSTGRAPGAPLARTTRGDGA